jgi:hypothetical protein
MLAGSCSLEVGGMKYLAIIGLAIVLLSCPPGDPTPELQ